MRKKGVYIATLYLFLTACSDITESPKQLPDVDLIRPDSIETSLNVININAPDDSINWLFEKFENPYFINASIDAFNNNGAVIFEGVLARIDIKDKNSLNAHMKSIGVHFNEDLNNLTSTILNPPLVMEDHFLDNLRSCRLRNSGDDFGQTMIKDLAYTRLAVQNNLNFEVMYGNPVHVFLNSKYHGLVNLRGEHDQFGISDLVNADFTDITLLEMEDGKFILKSGDQARADKLLNGLQNGDEKVLLDVLDLDSFMDYILFEDYAGNANWPEENCGLYSVGQGKFRFILFDLDAAAYQTKNALIPELEFKGDPLSKMYQLLFANDEAMLKKLNERQIVLYNHLSPESFENIVDQLASEIEDEISYLISRHKEPPSSLYWKLQLEVLKRDFHQRDSYLRKKYEL